VTLRGHNLLGGNGQRMVVNFWRCTAKVHKKWILTFVLFVHYKYITLQYIFQFGILISIFFLFLTNLFRWKDFFV
jgi:hypothetical protein